MLSYSSDKIQNIIFRTTPLIHSEVSNSGRLSSNYTNHLSPIVNHGHRTFQQYNLNYEWKLQEICPTNATFLSHPFKIYNTVYTDLKSECICIALQHVKQVTCTILMCRGEEGFYQQSSYFPFLCSVFIKPWLPTEKHSN